MVAVQAPAVQLSSLSCTPAIVTPPATVNCGVSLSAAATSSTVILLASSSGSISVPASVTIGSGSSSAVFAASTSAVATQTTGQVTATYSGATKSAVLTLQPPAAPVISSLQCTPNPVQGGSSTQCGVALSAAAPAGGLVIRLSDNSRKVSVPSSVTVAAGSTSAAFSVGTYSVSQDQVISIQATVTATSKVASSSLDYSLTVAAPPKVTGLGCTPSTIANREYTTCTVALSAVTGGDVNVSMYRSNRYLSIPGKVLIRAGQSSAAFQAQAQTTRNTTVTITAAWNGVSVKTTVTISNPKGTYFHTPGVTTSRNHDPVQFEVTASDGEDQPVTVAASELPAGAAFDATTGKFIWEPGGVAAGDYAAVFTATDAAGRRTQSRVMIRVRSGEPVIQKLLHGATGSSEQVCSPGSLAMVVGDGLDAGDGEQTSVWVNGAEVPVVRRAEGSLMFQCPALPAGVPLTVEARRGAAVSNTLETVMADAAPGIFSLDASGKGQGLVMVTEFQSVAMVRSPGDRSLPAMAGDRISVLATGLGEGAPADSVHLLVGGKAVSAESITAVSAGVWEVTGRLPEGTPTGGAVPVQLTVARYGRSVMSNVVTMATEGREVARE